MRYVLLFSDGSIHVGGNDEESQYYVKGMKGWRAAVGDLAKLVDSRAAREGKITNLEIQSHGLEAQIVVPPESKQNITIECVAEFGTMLKPLMTTGGLIEIMACRVAGFTRYTLESDKGGNQYPPEVVNEYFGGYEKDPVILEKAGGKNVVTRLQDTKAYMQAMAKARNTHMGLTDNGLEFCLTLARTSGAIVRASRLTQAEEYGDNWDGDPINPTYTPTHVMMRDYDRFGDWEGPVWDFMPNGSVKYLGCNLPRVRVRFPTHPVAVPTQLTYNFREQGGQSASNGQRPQRMNRSPLPV